MNDNYHFSIVLQEKEKLRKELIEAKKVAIRPGRLAMEYRQADKELRQQIIEGLDDIKARLAKIQ